MALGPVNLPHKDTHDPEDGSDPLDTATPTSIGTANAQGSSHSLARADHVHENPARWRRRHGHIAIPFPELDDEYVVGWFDDAFTLEQVRSHVTSATSVTYSIYERDYDTPESASGQSTVVNGHTATTTPSNATISDAAIAADKCLVLKITAVNGTPTKFRAFWRGTVD